MRRVSANELEVVSGGEDALDSISWTINVTVAEAAGNADVEVSVEQARSSDVD